MIWPGIVLELCHCPILLRVVHLQGEGPLGVVSHHLDLHRVDNDPAIQLTLVIWPVLVTLDLIIRCPSYTNHVHQLAIYLSDMYIYTLLYIPYSG